MKKWLAIGIALSFILNGCSTEKPESSKSNRLEAVPASQKYGKLATSQAALEKDSPIIVTVIKQNQENETLSAVSIQKIHKDTTQKLNINDQIAVLESDGTDVQLNGKPIPQDYYKKMEVGNSYRLYIRPSTSGNNYVLTNDFLSKYPTAKVAHEELLNNHDSSEISTYETLYYTIYDNLLEK
ncbi:hypothetical protein HB904_09235 [Listeria booriae]|uniref:Uncharacterized protein n=1 Tax=Listeria booriae TaxID=1552123 RepID=A0A841YLY2_9LIST|nr:hypothetical protein [Listeria booriae]MBC1401359.1 hypothetical protein [Listeria booriae]MBC1616372.1 hypothetical protein [Listeria booriae]